MKRPLLVILFLASGCLESRRGYECLAPANPGGGWDLTCRSVAQVLSERGLVDEPIRVRNVPGAGGGVAFAHVVAEREGDENVIVAASPATTLRLAQRQFGAFGEDHVRWLAAVAADFGIIAVRADAPWGSLPELVEAWRRSPGEIVSAGGSAVGGQDHMKLLLLADVAGLEPRSLRYVPFDGGGEALTALLGGFVDVVPADASEILSLYRAKSVRLLAALSERRLDPPFENVPTAREQGYDLDWVVWRGFYAPSDIGPEAYARWVRALRSVARSSEWNELCRKNALASFFLGGERFERFVREQVENYARLTARLGLSR